MMSEDSISVIIPAFNEENNLKAAIAMVSEVVERRFDEHEIIIFNDGSTDRTGNIAEMLASRNKNIKVIHHRRPKCLGGVYKEGVKIAKMNYLILVNGKNDTSTESLDAIFALRGKADIIIPYAVNSEERPVIRKIISKSFVALLNLIFRLNLRYYNHYVLHKRALINTVNLHTDSYAFEAEALIKLIKSGHSYIEIGVIDNFENDIKTKAFKLKNMIGVVLFLFRTIYEIYFRRVATV